MARGRGSMRPLPNYAGHFLGYHQICYCYVCMDGYIVQHGQFACEGETLDIVCEPRRQIRINSAKFGPASSSVCTSQSTTTTVPDESVCESTRALQIVHHR